MFEGSSGIVKYCIVLGACAAWFGQAAAEPPPGLDSVLLGTVYGSSKGSAEEIDLSSFANVRQAIEAACARLNSTSPHRVDESTYLVTCRVIEAKSIAFDLVLKGFDPSAPGVESFMQTARPILERSICRNPDVSALGNLGLSLSYLYRMGSTPVLTIFIKPGQCVPGKIAR